jgi:hypothetical protein
MPDLECSLLADGASDAALIPILEWVVRQHAAGVEVHCVWADMRRLPVPPRTLADRILQAVNLYPCDVLFVHRDAESQPPDFRYTEVNEAVTEARPRGFSSPHVCVVPVRMQEAWLLLDESAIRRASGNPNGGMALALPAPGAIEAIADPKATLHELLTLASGLHGRRRKRFRQRIRPHLVTDHMRNFACLRALPGFHRFETDVEELVPNLQLNGPP